MKKIILIIGGSGGIGAATAYLASKQGYIVCVNFRQDINSANLLIAKIKKEGGEAFSFQADVSDEGQVETMFMSIDKQVGPITALVNNAALIEPQQIVSEMNALRLQRVFATNIIGSFICSKEAIK